MYDGITFLQCEKMWNYVITSHGASQHVDNLAHEYSVVINTLLQVYSYML